MDEAVWKHYEFRIIIEVSTYLLNKNRELILHLQMYVPTMFYVIMVFVKASCKMVNENKYNKEVNAFKIVY